MRRSAGTTTEDLSGFNYLLNRSTLTKLEMDAGLDHLHGETKPLEDYLPLIGESFAYGFGRNGTLTMRGADGHDASAEVRQRMGENRFAEMVTTMNLELERKILRGPTDDELPDLRARGWNPELLRRGQESRLAFELETKQTLADNPEWRTGRLRDVISGRDVYHEWLDIFLKHLTERREQGLAHSLPSEAEMAGFWAAMPQVQVAISMKARYHRNTARTWTTNDISDIDAMSIAYPYCEAVFTDREARGALADTRDLRRFGTYLPKRPEELTAWLEDLPSVADSAALVPHPLYRS
jgi:hypothetical protein